MPDFKCPICKENVRHSEYLHSVFKDDVYAEYAACLVVHYRHQHIGYYNRSCHSVSYAKKSGFLRFGYADFKAMVNNRAKRQLIQAAKRKFTWKDAKPLIRGFLKLQNNDDKTVKLIDKVLHLNRFVKQARLDTYDQECRHNELC